MLKMDCLGVFQEEKSGHSSKEGEGGKVGDTVGEGGRTHLGIAWWSR